MEVMRLLLNPSFGAELRELTVSGDCGSRSAMGRHRVRLPTMLKKELSALRSPMEVEVRVLAGFTQDRKRGLTLRRRDRRAL